MTGWLMYFVWSLLHQPTGQSSMQMNSSPIKILFDYIKVFSKNLCFVGSATLCSKSQGILTYQYQHQLPLFDENRGGFFFLPSFFCLHASIMHRYTMCSLDIRFISKENFEPKSAFVLSWTDQKMYIKLRALLCSGVQVVVTAT